MVVFFDKMVGLSRSFFFGYRHYLSRRKSFTPRGASSLTRRRCIRVSSIVQDSPLLPPVGVWPRCQRSRELSFLLSGRLSEGNKYGGEGGIRTPGRGLGPYDGLANRCFRPLSHLSVFNSPDFSKLWSLSLHYTATFARRGTTVTTLSLRPNRSTARRLASSLECA